MEKRKVYFDHNATTPLHPEVKKTMIEMMDVFGNPSSLHGFGRVARGYVEEARAKVADFIGADPEEIMFVGSGSEANNTVLSILTNQCRQCNFDCRSGRGLITTTIEHPCILEASKCLFERGVDVSYIEVDQYGKVDMDQIRESVTPGTGLVSVMMANNEIGTIQDIRTIVELVHEKGALFHTDAVQAVGKIPVNVKDLDVDFLTLSGHKIYGPKGIGALYVRKGAPFCPLIRGGHQEKGRRAGTENTIGIVGIGKAIEMRSREMDPEEKRLLGLKQKLREGIEQSIPDIRFVGHPTDCLPGTLNVSFDGAEGEAIILYLDLEGIAVSTGSACASGSLDPSHVILATGLPAECAHGSIRISLGRDNTAEDIEYMLEVLPLVIDRIRSMSTVYARRK
ncbi:MAG TPA: aminotransferase class V-fold PLP-dependent enzyme [Deltaproteobacteria bacterium]|nr:aminotransferase class V-fold PLP-dependent enzyme [Deltaproteobacteria bacterium]